MEMMVLEVLLEDQLDQRERAKLDYLTNNHKGHQLQQVQGAAKSLS